MEEQNRDRTEEKITIELQWNRCGEEKWCNLFTLNLGYPTLDELRGVYIIFSEAQSENERHKTIAIGKGIVAYEIRKKRADSRIKAFPALRVTWADVRRRDVDGVERYLIHTLKPIVSQTVDDGGLIQVNLPFGAQG